MANFQSTTSDSGGRAKSHLLRILGVGFGVAVIVGNTIGSGILRTPGEIATQLGSKAWILGVWLLGGLYAFFCTLSVTELGTMLPFAGGWYVFSRRAFGEYGGFVVGCSDWMMQMVASAYLAVAFGEFAAQLQPGLQNYVKLLAVATLAAMGLLNWMGLRTGRNPADHQRPQSSRLHRLRCRLLAVFTRPRFSGCGAAPRARAKGRPALSDGGSFAGGHRHL